MTAAESVSATMPAVSRVVVRAPNWLGDAVLALPAMAAVRAAFAHAHVTIAAPAGLAGLYREDTNARPDQVLDLPDANRAAIAALASAKFDLAVLFPNSFRVRLAVPSRGHPRAVGLCDVRARLDAHACKPARTIRCAGASRRLLSRPRARARHGVRR